MTRYYKVDHFFEVPDEVDIDAFTISLIDWVESKSWLTGGNVTEVDEEGNKLSGSKLRHFTRLAELSRGTVGLEWLRWKIAWWLNGRYPQMCWRHLVSWVLQHNGYTLRGTFNRLDGYAWSQRCNEETGPSCPKCESTGRLKGSGEHE